MFKSNCNCLKKYILVSSRSKHVLYIYYLYDKKVKKMFYSRHFAVYDRRHVAIFIQWYKVIQARGN